MRGSETTKLRVRCRREPASPSMFRDAARGRGDCDGLWVAVADQEAVHMSKPNLMDTVVTMEGRFDAHDGEEQQTSAYLAAERRLGVGSLHTVGIRREDCSSKQWWCPILTTPILRVANSWHRLRRRKEPLSEVFAEGKFPTRPRCRQKKKPKRCSPAAGQTKAHHPLSSRDTYRTQAEARQFHRRVFPPHTKFYAAPGLRFLCRRLHHFFPPPPKRYPPSDNKFPSIPTDTR